MPTDTVVLFEEACRRVMRAGNPGFFDEDGTPEKTYRELAKLVHPDRAPSEALQDQAHEAFIKLQKLWQLWQLRSGKTSATITTRKGTFEYVTWAGSDSVADYFTASPSGSTSQVVLKRAKVPGRSDLFQRERETLSTLDKEVDDSFKLYIPKLETWFPLEDESGQRRQVHVFRNDYRLMSVASLMQVFPNGLDGRDVAWMWRRILTILSLAHKAGVVHGGLTPNNLLLELDLHGLVLHNWCFSVPIGSPVTIIDRKYRDWYSPETLDKKPASAVADIHLATTSMLALLRVGGANTALRAFGLGCRGNNAKGMSATDLLAELDQLLERLYGPRKFVPFPYNRDPDKMLLLPEWPATQTEKR